MIKRYFLHVDMDAFFASVEILDNPEYKDKPIIVGGRPEDRRSVVSTASYEARKYGVHSAMPTAQAYRLCPNGIFLYPRIKRYSELSHQIMQILQKYSPDVFQLSIDEACIDLTGTQTLFGNPEDIAKKIQSEVFEKTGLTISAGLASSKTLAKIASEINKPNGFYYIPHGKEEEFMLSLPLKKIIGIGVKTLEVLKNSGFTTTRQIHNKSKELLCLIFGQSMGSFLYNSVRGLDCEEIQTHSHSISNENTFQYDITTIYAAETALMELAQSVMFRLIREKKCSKTVTVKIRYEDFSTYTVRETGEDYITSVDDLFERAAKLFEKKYQAGRGIRLLGVCLENIEDEIRSKEQQILFDFGKKKKQAVENAIINLNKKHPEIKIQKARLLKTDNKIKQIVFFISFYFFAAAGMKIHCESLNTVSPKAATILDEKTSFLLPMPKENPISLFQYNINSSMVELFAQGNWKGELTTNAVFSFGSTSPAFSFSIPVFKQETDIAFNFMLNRQWYFQAAFADKFNKNTIAMGFYGKPENYLREVKIANRGINIPNIYSSAIMNRSIGGGENQAPGIMAYFSDVKNNKWQAHIGLRYDMGEQREAVFYGQNVQTSKKIAISDYIKSQMFVLPSQGFTNDLKNIYVENNQGKYKDKNGRTYKKLSIDDYLVFPSKNFIIISKDAVKSETLPNIVFEFNSNWNFQNELGDYDTPNSFLGKIQDVFPNSIKLKHYSIDYNISIDGKDMLLVQSVQGFSPFECAFRYDLGITNSTDVSIVSSSNEKSIQDFSAAIIESTVFYQQKDFFYENHKYADIYSSNDASQTYPASKRYPMAKKFPNFYLGIKEETDLCLSVKTYTPVSRYDIGTNAASASVKVYKNGILDSGAIYDSDSGIVSLSSSISDFDKIYITWIEDANESDIGTISAEAAFKYDFTDKLYGDWILSGSLPYSPYLKYAEYKKPASGFAAFTSGVYYKNSFLESSNIISLAMDNPNTTNLYRIKGDFTAVKTNYLTQNAGYNIEKNFEPHINNRISETLLLPNLKKENNFTDITATAAGERDSEISGYKIPLSWNFEPGKTNPWAGVNIKLSSGSKLKNAGYLKFLIKTENFIKNDYDVYLQLGVKADKEDKIEYTEKIPTWKISDPTATDVLKTFNTNISGWQEVEIRITDYDRSRFSMDSDLRLIVTAPATSSQNDKGRIFLGPYEISSKSFFIKHDEGVSAGIKDIIANDLPSKDNFNSSDNYAQKLSWEIKTHPLTENFIVMASHFDECNLHNYKKLEFFFKFDGITKGANSSGEEDFIFILDSDAQAISEEGKITVKAEIPIKELIKDSAYHKFTINLQDKMLEIDGNPAICNLSIDTAIIPTRIKIQIPLISENKLLDTGKFYFDELHLSESINYFTMQDRAEFSIEKKGSILETKNIKIIENPYFNIEGRGFAEISETKNFQAISSANAGFTLTKINFSVFSTLSTNQDKFITHASHKIATEKELFKILTFEDNYSFSITNSESEKQSRLALDFSKLNAPFKISAYVHGKSNALNQIQKANIQTEFNYNFEKLKLAIGASAAESQKIKSTTAFTEKLKEDGYFTGYAKESAMSFSRGEENAFSRSVKAAVDTTLAFQYAGISPKADFSTEQKYFFSNTLSQTNINTFKFLLPFKISSSSMLLTYTKQNALSSNAYAGGTYNTDWQQLGENLYKQKKYFIIPPFYDLFSDDFITKQQEGGSSYYSGFYSALWKRPIFADLRDLWIPANAELSLERDINTAEINTSNYYQIKVRVINTPFNLFGKTSRLKLFKLYNSDEYAISLSSTAKIPKSEPSAAVFNISAYLQSGFYMPQDSYLKTASDFTISNDKTWLLNSSVSWKRKGKSSPVESFIRLFDFKKKFGKISLDRNSGFDLQLNKNSSGLNQKYNIRHALNAKFSDFFTLTLKTEAGCSISPKDLVILNLEASIGGKISF